MKRKSVWSLATIAALVVGCTWVKLTPAGEQVSLSARPGVEGKCKKIGVTSAQVPDKLWFVERARSTVAEELDALARNEAAELGGNTVVPTSDEEQGRREFAVYTCNE